jgi:hypothetical protein
MEVQEDALEVTFSGSEPASLKITGPGLKLADYLENGVVSFRMKIEEPPAGALWLGLGEHSVDLASQAGAAAGNGWVDVSVPVACFVGDGAALDKVETPFSLSAASKAVASIGEVNYLKQGTPNVNCE